ncbi:MAG: hypothetical protein ACRET4_14920, partial [Steroidobacteraceae bacterium]
MSTLDERLSRLFGYADAPPDFEVRLMARVRAAETDPTRRRAARDREEATYAAARHGLQRWRRTALRMFSLDAVAGATLLIVLLGSLPRLLPGFGVLAPGLVITAVALAVAGYCAVQA